MRGSVVSNSMEKTLVVEVKRLVAHPLYKKRYSVSKKYKVHCEEGKRDIGDIIQFQETSPISKDKRWIIIENNKK